MFKEINTMKSLRGQLNDENSDNLNRVALIHFENVESQNDQKYDLLNNS